jgi:hypothetical protein
MTDYRYQSENVGDLMKALAKVQGKIQNITKASTNPHFKSAYADMAAVRAATFEALSAEGVTLLQPAEVADGQVTVTTELWFGDQFKRCPLSLPLPQSATPHVIGSAITYGKRYGVTSMLSLAAENEDDDGNAASQGNGRKISGDKVSAQQAKDIQQAILDTNANISRFLNAYGIAKIEEMPAVRYSEAMRQLDLKAARNLREAAGQPVVTEDGEVIE